MLLTKEITADEVSVELCNELANLQDKIWGFDSNEALPSWSLLITPKTGGLLAATFDDEKPVGLTIATPAFDPLTGEKFLYSQMTGLLPEYQNSGEGLKIAELVRDFAIRNKYNFVKWTFEPLEGNLANLYIGKSGGRINFYLENFYGAMTGKNEGLPSDRFWAYAHIGKTTNRIDESSNKILIENYSDYDEILAQNPNDLAIEIPTDFIKLKKENPNKAVEIRLVTRKIFQDIFSKGYEICNFKRENNQNFYLATRK